MEVAPNIWIDRLTRGCKGSVSLVSHFHSDHINWRHSKTPQDIFCSKKTREVLRILNPSFHCRILSIPMPLPPECIHV